VYETFGPPLYPFRIGPTWLGHRPSVNDQCINSQSMNYFMKQSKQIIKKKHDRREREPPPYFIKKKVILSDREKTSEL
jgi:hypothetical protein